MKVLLVVAAVLGGLGLFVGGFVLGLVGFADQRVADHVYVVSYKHPGDDCGPEVLELDVDDGVPLACSPVPLMSEADVDLPGFSEAQNAEVADLAKQLGLGGLSAEDQQQIQALVDRYAAGVPASQQPYPAKAFISWHGIWGARLGWTGVGMVAAAVLIYIALRRA